MYRFYTFSRWPMNNGTTIHTTAKSYIAYRFADRYLGISPTIHVALQLYEPVFYTKSNQNLIVHTSTEHLLSAFTKKYIIFLKNLVLFDVCLLFMSQRCTEFFIFCGTQYFERNQTLEHLRTERIFHKTFHKKKTGIFFTHIRLSCFLNTQHLCRHMLQFYLQFLLF